MYKVTKDGDFYKFCWRHNYYEGPSTNFVYLADVNVTFLVKGELTETDSIQSDGIMYGVIMTVQPVNAQGIEYTAVVTYDEESDDLSNSKFNSKMLYQLEKKVSFNQTDDCKVQFKILSAPGSFINDYITYVSDKPNVTMVGTDGEVQVKKKILKMRSPVFRAMFEHNTKEKDSLRIEMKDYTKETLEAFAEFLTTDVIDENSNHAIDLFVLGDKYDIPLMKSRAENIMLSNVNDSNGGNVFDALIKIKPEVVKEYWLKHQLKK